MSPPDWTPSKIVVAFDPVCGSPGLLDAAAELAGLLGAELEAMLLDDPDITRLSTLPFGRMIELSSGKTGAFDVSALRAARAGRAARSKAVLRQLSQLHRCVYSVQDLPGGVLADIEESSSAELIVVAAFHGKFGGMRNVDDEAVRLAIQSLRSVLLVAQLPVSTQNILVVADDSPAGERASNLARAIAARNHGSVRKIQPDPSNGHGLALKILGLQPTLVVLGLSDSEVISEVQESLKSELFSMLITR